MDKKTAFRLSVVFGLIYFFSTNGLASLPGIAINFLLKDVLKMTASQSAYFGAVTLLGWVIKPLWGIISDAFPICGYRRKPYLVLTTLSAALIWLYLGRIENYTVAVLLALFTLSSTVYAFNDVVTDGLMVQTGKPHGLTGRFQSVQWG
ncbi:MAG: PucC family protein, partial [Parcubacteria group bacterium]|nr:PucC family protein [Parcubacteria group bacterium]